MSVSTLVFGDDGSREADLAWAWVTSQTWPGWGIDVVACQPPPFGPPVGEERARLHPWSPPEPRQPDPNVGFASVRHLLAEADPRIVLTESGDAGLVVVGRTGGGALKSLHLGSTAEYVVQHQSAPVLLAKKATAVRSVLVCTDGSVHATRAVDALAVMPWLGQVEHLAVIGTYLDGKDADQASIEAAVTSSVERLESLPGLACAPEPILRESAAAVAILRHGEVTSADLIVMGTKGLSRFKRGLLWGSVARSVIKSTDASVLVAHHPE